MKTIISPLSKEQKEERIVEAINVLSYAIQNKISLSKASRHFNKDSRFVNDVMRGIIKKKNPEISVELKMQFIQKRDEFNEVLHPNSRQSLVKISVCPIPARTRFPEKKIRYRLDEISVDTDECSQVKIHSRKEEMNLRTYIFLANKKRNQPFKLVLRKISPTIVGIWKRSKAEEE